MNSLSDIAVTCVDSATLEGIRPRTIGRNAKLGVHGQIVKEPVVRLHTNVGITGVGRAYVLKEEAQLLVGRRLEQVFDPVNGTIEQFMRFDMPLWDLAGRILEKPVYELLGARGCRNVPLYDSSIYFDDLDPETGKDKGIKPILDEVDQGLKQGFRAFKMKIGRGYRWMDKSSGFFRDTEVIRAVRESVGPNIRLLIDANNGYTPDEAREVMRHVGECNLFWFEEPFEEDKEECLSFRNFLDKHGWKTMIADGEGSQRRMAEFTEIVYAGGVDVVQFDWRPFPFTRWLQYTRKLPRKDIHYAPHNWGSYFGGFYVAHFCRGFERSLLVEWDTMTMADVSAEGYTLSKGFLTIPEKPGFGLDVNETSFMKAIEQGRGWSVD